MDEMEDATSSAGTESPCHSGCTCEDLMSKGDELSQKGGLEAALQIYIDAVNCCPDNCETWRRLATCFFRLKRDEEAEDAANQGLEATGDSGLHWHLALAIGRQGRAEEALQHLDLIGDQPWSESPMVYGNRAFFLRELGRYKEALPFIRHAWRHDKNPWTAFTLAYIYLDLGHTRRALRMLKRAIKTFEGEKRLHGLYAWALIKHGAYKKAEEQAKRVLEIDPTDLHGMRHVINSAMLAGDAARAVSLAEEYKAACPENDLNYFYGLALRRMGRFKEALEALDTIDPHDDDLPEWLYERGLCYLGLREVNEAQKIQEELSQVNPELAAGLHKALVTGVLPPQTSAEPAEGAFRG
jgi:tetratricopeptide (TPR) repeat protein